MFQLNEPHERQGTACPYDKGWCVAQRQHTTIGQAMKADLPNKGPSRWLWGADSTRTKMALLSDEAMLDVFLTSFSPS